MIKRVPARITPGLAAVAVVAGILLLSAPAPLESQHLGAWKRDWTVRCTWLDRLLLEKTSQLFITLFSKMDASQLAEEIAEFNCDDTTFGLAGLARQEFRASSYWLEELGFPDPIVNLAPDKRKYIAWLDQHLFRRRDAHGQLLVDSNGRHIVDENGTYYDTGEIYVSPPLLRRVRPAEAHETFHGVQNSATPMAFRVTIPYLKWVWEGTARAIDQAWSRKPGTRYLPGFEGRYFDQPLYWIPNVPDWTVTTPAYATAAFWLDVGRQLRSEDWIAYLPDVLRRLSGASGGFDDMMKLIDQALESLYQSRGIEGRGGFYRAYPEFVRFALSDPDNAADHFELVQSVDLSLPSPQGGGPVHQVQREPPRRPGSGGRYIGPLAADAYKVRVRVPPGRMASLRIEFATSYSNHHLIVDDRRYNRWTGPDDYDKRNIFGTTISGSDEVQTFYVRVASVSNPVTQVLADSTYTLNFTLTSDHALAIATGSENVRVDDGVLFSYVNVNRNPADMARSIQESLIDRTADHAGISGRTPDGRQTRQQIAGAAESQLGRAPAPLARDAGKSAVTPGARCMATITVFDDESRSVAKMIWNGSRPLLGGTHPIQASFATGLHDSVYSQVKNMGQELTLLEDPEALARWRAELEGLTLPGLVDGLMTAGKPGEAAKLEGALGGLLRGLPARRPREGQPPAPKQGQTDWGRTYSEGGTGTLEVEPGPGDKIVGRFQFRAVDPEADKAVDVEGQFIAVPGPLSTDNLWNGCENMVLHPEDNRDITPEPAVYPFGFDTGCTDEHSVLYCFCVKYPTAPACYWWPGVAPINCQRGPKVTTTVERDWHDIGFVDGQRVERRTLRQQPEILVPAANGGHSHDCQATFVDEDREVPSPEKPPPVDCEPGEGVTVTVEQDWHDVGVEGEFRLQQRRVRLTPEVKVPAQNGGDDSRCRSRVETETRKVPARTSKPTPVDCEPADEVVVTVEEDWHVVKVDGRLVRQRRLRLTPVIRVPAQHGGDDSRCRPSFKTEEKDIPPEIASPVIGSEPRSPEPTERAPQPTAAPPTPAADITVLRGKLLLDFLEDRGLNIRSAEQEVTGSASVAQIAVTAGAFNLGLALTDAEMAPCGFNQSVRMGLRMMASGRMLGVRLQLDVASGQLQLESRFDQGVILIRGPAVLTPLTPNRIRGDVTGSALELRLDQGKFSCASLMDFAFTVTDVR